MQVRGKGWHDRRLNPIMSSFNNFLIFDFFFFAVR